MSSPPAAPPTERPPIELRGVQKRFDGAAAVRRLDLTIPSGATYGLLGPNGAGKTTTIRMVLDILQPDAGEIRLFGRPVAREGLDRIGYLPEERGVYRRMRVRRLLSFLAELKGLRPQVSRPRIDDWLRRFELADRADDRVEELSKGMQQKLQFIAAVVHDPAVVILDEPFSGLDPINQAVLKDVINDLKRQGRTVLFSTHIIDHAERICDHVCIIARGETVVDGPMPEVKRAHGSGYVALGFEQWTARALEAVRRSPLVERVREQGADAEVTLRDGADAQALLERLVAEGIRLRRFERVEPSLEQIFVERVGADPAAAMRVPEVARA